MTASPALQPRQREIFERFTGTLASLVAAELGVAADDVEPWVIADALIGLHRALISYTHRQALAGVSNRRIARNLVTHGQRALELLEHGIGAVSVR
jgi:MftR C-terminal domain